MTSPQWDTLWHNATLTTETGLLKSAAIAVKDGKIAWVGNMQELPGRANELATAHDDLKGCLLTPGFIDCHTHLVYAGDRSHEFEMRLQGMSYETIAKQGGGIQYSVKQTRLASEEDLFQQSLPRAKALMASGVTTLEIKSGYGLNWETELKMLRVAKKIGEVLPLTIKKTFLGAHTIPQEFRNRSDDYVNVVCQEMIPQVAAEKLADAVDVFCESIAFSLAQTEKIFQAATDHDLAVKCHAEQLSNSECAALAAKYHALSVDHLEYLSEAGVAAIAKSGTTAVLLPGAFYFLREKHLPPIELLKQYQVPIAIASDCNPGTSPIMSMLIILNMASVVFGLTPAEALLAATKNAAKALGMGATHGTLSVGKVADFAIWSVDDPVKLSYYLGGDALVNIVKAGKVI